MLKDKNFIALIPARGGSKGLSRKNVLTLRGKPLISYTIEAALHSNKFSSVYVTTEDDEIAKISKHYGAKIIKRPFEIAQDDTKMSSVIKHAYDSLKDRKMDLGPFFCLLQPTSPLRKAEHILDCTSRFFKEENFSSAVSVCENSYSPFKSLYFKEGALTPLFSSNHLAENRQHLERTYRQNGAIYITAWSDFLEKETFINFPAMAYIMNEEESLDIDTNADLAKAEEFLKLQNRNN